MNWYKLLIVLFFAWTVVDRLRNTFGRESIKRKDITSFEKINSAIMIFLYVAIALDGLVGFLISNRQGFFFFNIFGILLYLLGRYLRNSAIQALRHQWNIYVSANPIGKIINLGPYEYMRHPYYSGTILELVGYGILFASFRAIFFTIVIFLPMILLRVYLEEQNLVHKFQKEYEEYKNTTNIVVSLKKFLENHSFFGDTSQLISIVKNFGIFQIAKIRFMSNSVERYSRGYAVSRIAGAMIEVGFVDALLKNPEVDLLQFAKGKGYDFNTLKIVCDYFSVLGIFKKRGFAYTLSEYGKKLFSYSRGVFTLLYAYMPVFEDLPDVIRKKKIYGKDIFRKSEFVGIGSNELAELLPFPYAKDMLKRHNLHKILDLGCGAGDFLINFCRENGFGGYGVDISPEVIGVAQKSALQKGISDRVKFQVGDILALDKLDKECKGIDVLIFMFVLHEFLTKDHDTVVRILRHINEKFPDKFVLISEVYRWSLPQLIASPVPVAEHHLFHRLSHQGLANLKEWRSIFRTAGFEIVEERRFDRAAQAYFLLKAKK